MTVNKFVIPSFLTDRNRLIPFGILIVAVLILYNLTKSQDILVWGLILAGVLGIIIYAKFMVKK